MTYETYRYIFIGCLCLSILLFVTAVILFFVLHIPNVIGDLSGANAKKAIEHIRNKNESTGEKTYKSSKVNTERGKITEKISISGRLHKHTTGPLYGAMPTEKISTQKLTANETTVLNTGGRETTVLDIGGNETTVLLPASDVADNIFTIEYEITYIHTNEIIV